MQGSGVTGTLGGGGAPVFLWAGLWASVLPAFLDPHGKLTVGAITVSILCQEAEVWVLESPFLYVTHWLTAQRGLVLQWV